MTSVLSKIAKSLNDSSQSSLRGPIPQHCIIHGCNHPPTNFVSLAGPIVFFCKEHYSELMQKTAAIHTEATHD